MKLSDIPTNVPVAVYWKDATFRHEYEDAQVPGVINITYGHIIALKKDFVIIAGEVDVPGFGDFGPRHVSEIPVSLLVKIQYLVEGDNIFIEEDKKGKETNGRGKGSNKMRRNKQ